MSYQAPLAFSKYPSRASRELGGRRRRRLGNGQEGPRPKIFSLPQQLPRVQPNGGKPNRFLFFFPPNQGVDFEFLSAKIEESISILNSSRQNPGVDFYFKFPPAKIEESISILNFFPPINRGLDSQHTKCVDDYDHSQCLAAKVIYISQTLASLRFTITNYDRALY
jgi:hypothetical protein